MEFIKETVMLEEYEKYLQKEGKERQGDWEKFLKALTALINEIYTKGMLDNHQKKQNDRMKEGL